MSTDWIVLDIEIAKTIEETPGGWNATDQLGVAVACLYDFRLDRLRIYGPQEIDELRARVYSAERITTFNGWRFDFPVLFGLPQPERVEDLRTTSDDLLRRIWTARRLNPDTFNPKTHGGYKLDTLCLSTLGVGKIGNGADAPKWYQAGQVQRVASYCADDVFLTRDLALFIDRFGFCLRDEDIIRVPKWEGGV